jgi:citrate lyase subunit alpha/citrate CoA-transferase
VAGRLALPAFIHGYGPVTPWDGEAFEVAPPRSPRSGRSHVRTATLEAALEAAGLQNGATLSFHHHLRDGDALMVHTLAVCAKMGLRDLHIAPSSIFPCHAGLVPLIERGVITRITTSYMNGPVADAIRKISLATPAVLQTHGGRAAAIESGKLAIDVAVIAAPGVDAAGNLTGSVGRSACGPLGYAMVDAAHAGHVIAVADMPDQILPRICIPNDRVDQIVKVDSLGDASRIASGTTAGTPSPEGKKIAAMTAALIATTEMRVPGFSFQTGAGATSIAVAKALGPLMAEHKIVGEFACGGMTAPLVEMHVAGLFRELRDVQAFDQAAVPSYTHDPTHLGISASDYASPARADTVAHQLGVVVLGAAEVDRKFNINVTTTREGHIIGGSGGHSDVAEGARMTIVTTSSRSKRGAKIVRDVLHKTTPGTSVDAVVTEAGVTLSGDRWRHSVRVLQEAGIPILSRHNLFDSHGDPAPRDWPDGRIVAVSEYRDGRVIDVIRAN